MEFADKVNPDDQSEGKTTTTRHLSEEEIRKKYMKQILEKIIENNKKAIINPYAYPNVDEEIKKLLEMGAFGFRSNSDFLKVQKIISNIIDEEVKKYDCNKEKNKKNATISSTVSEEKKEEEEKKKDPCDGIVAEDTPIGKHQNWKKMEQKRSRDLDPEYQEMMKAIKEQEEKEQKEKERRRKEEPIKFKIPKREKKTARSARSGSPNTVTAVKFNGGRKKTRRRRKKKSKRKKTRRRRKKKKTKKKRKVSRKHKRKSK